MKESDMQTIFTRWLSKNRPSIPTAYELKITKTNSLPFKRLYEHQKINLLKVIGQGKYYKIPDMQSATGFSNRKPFDCFFLKGEAYVVVWYYKPRKRREFIFIPIEKWIETEKTYHRKSLLEEDAKKIGRVEEVVA